MILDLHIHSKYSFDSILEPKRIIKVAKKRGLDGIAITDHNTIKGSIEAKKINSNPDFLVIVGSEINTEIGDITGLFLKEEIKSRNSMEVIEEIKKQGGIVVLPHPFRGHKLNDKLISAVDVIESFNSRSGRIENEMSAKLAKRCNKPVIAGSDAHFSSEIGAGKIIIKNSCNTKNIRTKILKREVEISVIYSPIYLQPLSQMIKSIKVGDYKKIPFQFYNLINSFKRVSR
jgi:predicted metal-dependent phosphoesterase TrpH